MIKAEKRTFLSLNMDSSPMSVKATQLLGCKNFRLTDVEGGSFLCLETEKGTKKVEIKNNISIEGHVLGVGLLPDYIVLFTHSENFDFIYRLEQGEETDSLNAKIIYQGHLNFNDNNKITTYPLYEASNIQKIYWIDGINQLRCVEVTSTSYTSNTHFDSFQNISTYCISGVKIDLKPGTGIFPAGVVQYVVTLGKYFLQETPPIYTTPLYLLTDLQYGKEEGKTTGLDINISFTLQKEALQFDFVNVYSIIRSSLDTTASTKLVSRVKIDNSSFEYKLTIVDQNIGNSKDPADLLYLGGISIIPSTLGVKNNTLFLGGLKTNQNIFYRKEDIFTNIELEQGNKSYSELNLKKSVNLNISSRIAKRFKYLEYYKLGVRVKFKDGSWSNPIFIDRIQSKQPPIDGYKNIFRANFNCALDKQIECIQPILVENNNKTILCQGVISPTVFNIKDRCDNSPYSQSSWFFRPIASKLDENPEYRHYRCIPDNKKLNSEIQNIVAPSTYPIIPYLDRDGYYNNSEVTDIDLKDYSIKTKSYYLSEKWTSRDTSRKLTHQGYDNYINTHSEYYYVDQNILTLNSPDLETKDIIDLNAYHFRIVGIVPISGYSYGMKLNTTPAHTGDGITTIAYGKYINKKQPYYGGNKVQMTGINWIDYPNYEKSSDKYDRLLQGFCVYPWHSNAPLAGDVTSDATTPGMLESKVINNTRIANESIYLKPESCVNYTSVSSSFFNKDYTSVNLKQGDNNIIYTGNIDSLSTINTGASAYYMEFASPDEADPNNIESLFFTDKRFGFPITGILNTSRVVYPANLNNRITSRGDIKKEYDNMEKIYNESTYCYKNNPVSIKYKSNSHIVINLGNSSQGNILPCLNTKSGVKNQLEKTSFSPLAWIVGGNLQLAKENYTQLKIQNTDFFYKNYKGKLFFNKSLIDNKYDNDVSNNFDYDDFLYLGELYTDPTELQEDLIEASNNKWIPAGDIVSVKKDGTANVFWEEGDTYYQRYDCLKTYPHTEKDLNSIIEVLSFMCETSINLDAQYSKNKDKPNVFTFNADNFLKINPVYSQSNNFYTYSYIEEKLAKTNYFPSTITWSTEKQYGNVLDNWLHFTMVSTIEADGKLGKITAITLFNTNLFVFQEEGVSRLKYNEETSLTSTEGTPLELGNTGKVTGIVPISVIYGTTKQEFVTQDSQAVYYYNPNSKEIIALNDQGVLNFSVKSGVQTWFNNHIIDRLSFNEKTNEVLFFGHKEGEKINREYLVFSNNLNSFSSTYDSNHYDKTLQYDVLDFDFKQDHLFLNYNENKHANIHKQHAGEYGNYLDEKCESYLEVLVSPDTEDKVFDNIEYRSSVFNAQNTLLPNDSFTKLEVWNEHQRGENILTNIPGKPGSLKRKFRIWRAQVPRDTLNPVYGRNNNRIRNPWAYMKLTIDKEHNNNRLVLNDMTVYYSTNA